LAKRELGVQNPLLNIRKRSKREGQQKIGGGPAIFLLDQAQHQKKPHVGHLNDSPFVARHAQNKEKGLHRPKNRWREKKVLGFVLSHDQKKKSENLQKNADHVWEKRRNANLKNRRGGSMIIQRGKGV